MNSTASEPSPSSSRVLTVPNAISAARIASIPVFVALILDHDTTTPGLILFAIVVATGLPRPEAETDRDARQAQLPAEPVLQISLVRAIGLMRSSEDHEGRRAGPHLRGVMEVPR